MSWIKLIIYTLKVAGAIAGYLKNRQMLRAGEDVAIGRAALEVLQVTEYGRKLIARVDVLGEEELRDLEKRLEE